MERVDVEGRCQRHTGAYRSFSSASVKVSQFGVTYMFLGELKTFVVSFWLEV